jgi:hypothetical protein
MNIRFYAKKNRRAAKDTLPLFEPGQIPIKPKAGQKKKPCSIEHFDPWTGRELNLDPGQVED